MECKRERLSKDWRPYGDKFLKLWFKKIIYFFIKNIALLFTIYNSIFLKMNFIRPINIIKN